MMRPPDPADRHAERLQPHTASQTVCGPEPDIFEGIEEDPTVLAEIGHDLWVAGVDPYDEAAVRRHYGLVS